jgi:hypothetical protein
VRVLSLSCKKKKRWEGGRREERERKRKGEREGGRKEGRKGRKEEHIL